MFNHSSNLSISSAMIRSTALLVFLLSALFLITGNGIPVLFLSLDFLLRAVGKSRLSPLSRFAAKFMAPRLHGFKGFSRVNPKRFAALIGFVLSTGASLFFITGFLTVSYVLMAVLAFFSFLETAFNFCAGCKMYGLLIKAGLVQDEMCEECQIRFGKKHAA